MLTPRIIGNADFVRLCVLLSSVKAEGNLRSQRQTVRSWRSLRRAIDGQP